MMHSDLIVCDLYHVTTVRDEAGSPCLNVARVVQEFKCLISRSKAALQRMGVGEELDFDCSCLVRNIPHNARLGIFSFLQVPETEWLYVLPVDERSHWYMQPFRVVATIPSAEPAGHYMYHVVLALQSESGQTTRVKVEGTMLVAR